MPNNVKDMTLNEILYVLEEEATINLVEMINSTAGIKKIKETLELIYLIRQIRNID